MRNSPPVWREPHRAKRQLQGSKDRRDEATWKGQTFFNQSNSIQLLRNEVRWEIDVHFATHVFPQQLLFLSA